MGIGPDVNEQFPIRESLSPPEIARPVFECAEAVYVTGFMAHAKLTVFANLNEVLAEVEPPFGFWTVPLNRRVKEGEMLTATQEVNGQPSAHSLQPVRVQPLDGNRIRSTRPAVLEPIYQCGVIVPVDNLVPSTKLHVTEDADEIGNMPVAQTYHPVLTNPLKRGEVSAFAVACEGTDHEVRGPDAAKVTPWPAPVPVPAPVVDPGSLIPGNDVVTLTGLLTGAGVEIFDQGVSICSGWKATGGTNWFPIQKRLGNTPITATQELCGNVSPPSEPEIPEGKLEAPEIIGPICPGSSFVVVRKSTVNAVVVIFRNGSPMTHGGAAPGDLILGLGQGASLNSGDDITAVQYMNGTLSPLSNTVTVGFDHREAVVEILGGNPFFSPNANEEPIPGPVFPRGNGTGPLVRIQACCSENVKAWITGSENQHVADLELDELFPGYFQSTWNWTSVEGWNLPDEIPVGEYKVRTRSACTEGEGIGRFFVVFDPAAAGGPARFSFDPTAVWFGTGDNSISGLHYYLRCSDWRVFRIAIQASSGQTDPFKAAIEVARAEEALFNYSLAYHTNDVLDLILNYSDAQCADDAGCLTALLRAVGIPAHPVTADAGLETGAGSWTFDTWVEFLAEQNGVSDWQILHPHEFPGMQPEPRAVFGKRGVADKSFNDLIVMAGESWVSAAIDDGASDVSYGRSSCGEPMQAISKASWVEELCEAGYWTQTHWDCANVHPNSLSSGNGLRFTEDDLIFGGHIAGTVHLVNQTEHRISGEVVVELVAHRLENKAFNKQPFQTASLYAAIDPDTDLQVPFSFDLPRTLAPGEEVYLRARLDDRTAALHNVKLKSPLQAAVEMPKEWQEGEVDTLRAMIENTGREAAQDVEINFEVPFALSLERHRSFQLGSLEPGEQRELAVPVRSVAPLPSGSLHLAVTSRNAGALLLRLPFRVRERPAAPETTMGFRPPR